MAQNKKILLVSNSLDSIKTKIDITRQDIKFISMEDSAQIDNVRDFLKKETFYKEVSRAKLLQENRDQLRQKYIEFMGRLNVENAGKEWWALDMSTKNMLITFLGQNIIYCKLISMILNESDVGGLVVLSSDKVLARQLRSWARAQRVNCIDAVARKPKLGSLTVHIPIYIIFYFFKTLLLMLVVKRTFRINLTKKKYIVILSLINYQSFSESGKYQDTYFGDLAERLRERGENVLVFGKIINKYNDNIAAIKSSGEKTVLPMEYFLTIGDIIHCAGLAIIGFLKSAKIKGDTHFEGFDVRYLLSRQKKLDLSRRYFVNLIAFYCAKRLSSKINIDVFLYPFENRAFEKMCLLALRSTRSDQRIVGYNHTPVTHKHTNLSLMPEEIGVVPMPDSVITIGKVTSEILRSSLNLPAAMIKTGCALRQKNTQVPEIMQRPRKVTNLFVALTGEIEDYVSVLLFIKEALKNDPEKYHFLLRPHPIMPLAPALEIIGELGFSFEDTGAEPLVEVLGLSHVALNTSSAVGIEAASRGIPIIYIDYGDVMLSDPLSELHHLKWTIRESSGLIDIIDEIDALGDEKFKDLQKLEAEFANSYLIPATPENIDNFVDTLYGRDRAQAEK